MCLLSTKPLFEPNFCLNAGLCCSNSQAYLVRYQSVVALQRVVVQARHKVNVTRVLSNEQVEQSIFEKVNFSRVRFGDITIDAHLRQVVNRSS